MTTTNKIRPYLDKEVAPVLQKYRRDPMMKALLRFAFPDKKAKQRNALLDSCSSIADFQTKIVYHAVQNVIGKTTDAFTTKGFDRLDKNTAYLFISNHRDIVLDTSLLNIALHDHGLIMTSSAIGDNLVQQPFLSALSRLNRNFLIQRDLPPREMLLSSRVVSEYIHYLLEEQNRSVWIAQREGRTKDGDDTTQQGVLKMLALADTHKDPMAYFKKLKIVPVSISYELDPTDVLKIPELLAKYHNKPYVKKENEDFNSILRGVLGHKKRVHITAGSVLDTELDAISNTQEPVNKQFQLLAGVLDQKIHQLYHLWPSNYIASDILTQTKTYQEFYTDKEKRQFLRRIKRRVPALDAVSKKNFLTMYAHPVKNKLS